MIAQQEGVLVTSCSVDFGSSGAPIFSLENGEAHVVSVVSAKAEVEGETVSLGTALSTPLALLQAQMVAGQGVFPVSGSGSKSILAGQRSTSTGAKFVRP